MNICLSILSSIGLPLRVSCFCLCAAELRDSSWCFNPPHANPKMHDRGIVSSSAQAVPWSGNWLYRLLIQQRQCKLLLDIESLCHSRVLSQVYPAGSPDIL